MLMTNDWFQCLLYLCIISSITAVSVNQPIFSSNASWDINGTTFANNDTISANALHVFVDIHNTVYVANRDNDSIQVWFDGDSTHTKMINMNMNDSGHHSLFVTSNGDIYVDVGRKNRIEKWTLNGSVGISVMEKTARCLGLFVDDNETIYCSLHTQHKVIAKQLNSTNQSVMDFVGRDCPGLRSDMLYEPWGLFLDTDFNLFVADSRNDRIQKFAPGNRHATTVAGMGAANTVILDGPTGIVLDADGNMFIVDRRNDRIVRSDSNGFYCIIGCRDQLNQNPHRSSSPTTFSFDSNGNIYVMDTENIRIQRFLLTTDSSNIDETSTVSDFISTGVTEDLTVTVPTDNSESSTTDNPDTSMAHVLDLDTDGTSTVSDFISTVETEGVHTDSMLTVSDDALGSSTTEIPNTLVASYNQPKFCSYPTWNPEPLIMANRSTISWGGYGIFVDRNDTVYAVARGTNQILIWLNSSNSSLQKMEGPYTDSYGIFVTDEGEIFIDNGNWYDRVERIVSNGSNSTRTFVLDVSRACYGLFVDIYNNLYCSVHDLNQVLKKSLDFNRNDMTSIVAGTGCEGNAAHMLTDCGNNRIQVFKNGDMNGTTVVGRGAPNTTDLNCPTGIIIDADEYMYISDNNNHRIIRSGPSESRCIIGCTDHPSCESKVLKEPQALSFDSYGNLYVTEWPRHQLKKFFLASNSCYPTTTTVSSSHDCAISTTLTDAASTSLPEKRSSVSIKMESSTIPTSLTCQTSNTIGLFCNISNNACDMAKPCQNNGNCTDTSNTGMNFICVCPDGFAGFQCEIDVRLCPPNRCLNNGTCNETSNSTFECLCRPGWTGQLCEIMINHCVKNLCVNNGVCRPSLLNYTCECLGDSYYGRHCEMISQTTYVHQTVAKSFASIVIIFLGIIVIFVILMDVLKYGFGIDPVKHERERLRLKNHRRMFEKKRRPIAIRFIYVN